MKPIEFFLAAAVTIKNETIECLKVETYPKLDEEQESIVRNIIPFCFPFEASELEDEDMDPVYHEFVLTDEKGQNKYAGCLRSRNFRILLRPAQDRGNDSDDVVYSTICMVSQYPRWNLLKKSIFAIHQSIFTGHYTGTISAIVNNIVEPPQGIAVKLRLSKHYPPVTVASLHDTKSDMNLAHLIEVVSIPTFVKIFSRILLEKSVFVHSRSCSLLTRTGEALLSLLSPLTWQMVYVPVIPPQLQDLTQAPTPFFMGGHSSWASCVKPPEVPLDDNESSGDHPQFVTIDLDNFIADFEDDVSCVPYRSSLIYKLRQVLKLDTQSFDRLEDSFADMKDKFTNKRIHSIFAEWLLDVIGDIVSFYKQDGRFDEKNWILSKPDATKTFYATFAKTHMFHDFIESKKHLTSQSIETLSLDPFDQQLIAKTQTKAHKRVSTFGQSLPVAVVKEALRRISLSPTTDDTVELVLDLAEHSVISPLLSKGVLDTNYIFETVFEKNPLNQLIEQLNYMSPSPKIQWFQARSLATAMSDHKTALQLLVVVWNESVSRDIKNTKKLDDLVRDVELILKKVPAESKHEFIETLPEDLSKLLERSVHHADRKSPTQGVSLNQEPLMDRMLMNCNPRQVNHVIDSTDTLDDDSLVRITELDADSKAMISFPVKLSVAVAEIIVSMFQVISNSPYTGDQTGQSLLSNHAGGSMNELGHTAVSSSSKSVNSKKKDKLSDAEKLFQESHYVLSDTSKIRMVKRMPTYEKFREKALLLQLVKLEDLPNDDEKLAFWLNVRTSLLLHIFVEFGVPMNNAHRLTFTNQKPVYLVGQHYFSINDITYGILRSGLHLPSHVSPKNSVSTGTASSLPVTGDSELTIVNVFATGNNSNLHPQDMAKESSSQPKDVWPLKFKKNDPRIAYKLSHNHPLISFVVSDATRSSPRLRVFRRDQVLPAMYTEAIAYLDRQLETNKTVTSEGPKTDTSFLLWNTSKKRQISLPQHILWHIRDFIATNSHEDFIPYLFQLFPTSKYAKFMREEGIIKLGYQESYHDTKILSQKYYTEDFEKRMQARLAESMIDWNRLVVKIKEYEWDFELKTPFDS